MRWKLVNPAVLLSAFALTAPATPILADTLTVVALGASNTSGWGVGAAAAYPAQLQTLLRGAGHDVQVVNAGRAFDTTNGMLGRLDTEVPPQTDLVVIQPGGNDLRFFGTHEKRAANIDAMVARLTERSIKALVYDPVFPSEAFQWDRIHINADWHRRIAEELMPHVIEAIGPQSEPPMVSNGNERERIKRPR